MLFRKGNVIPNRKVDNLDCRTFRISAILYSTAIRDILLIFKGKKSNIPLENSGVPVKRYSANSQSPFAFACHKL